MELVKPSIEFLYGTYNPLQKIEIAGRTCYKSEDKITDDSAIEFVKKLLSRGHEAMIEHASMSYRIICDRGVTHEIVRHRLFSYAQESTRYCNYKGGITFIIPPWTAFHEGEFEVVWDNGCIQVLNIEDMDIAHTDFEWLAEMASSELRYKNLIAYRWIPQQARSVLPNSLKTEIVVTGNMREWRHFFKLRCAKTAHPQMQEVANMILDDIKCKVSVLFDEFKG